MTTVHAESSPAGGKPGSTQGMARGMTQRIFLILFCPLRAPVAQGIEHRPPEAGAQVRILPGALAEKPRTHPGSGCFVVSGAGGDPYQSRGGAAVRPRPGPSAAAKTRRHATTDLDRRGGRDPARRHRLGAPTSSATTPATDGSVVRTDGRTAPSPQPPVPSRASRTPLRRCASCTGRHRSRRNRGPGCDATGSGRAPRSRPTGSWQRVPVYAHEFADRHSPLSSDGQGAAHAMELPYLFALGGFELPLAPEQERCAEQMVDYWTAFAHT